MNVFIMVILPKGVVYLFFQEFNILDSSTTISLKFKFGMAVKSVEKAIPSKLNDVEPHFSVLSMSSLVFEPRFFPTHTTCVLSVLTTNPE